MRIHSLVLLLGIITVSSCAQKNPTDKQASNNKLIFAIDSLMNTASHKAFRGSVLISKQNEIAFHKSYGNRSSDVTSAFWIGSISKSFTAAAILKLQEDNKLSVSDSLHKFINNVPPDKLGITLHHLLTHTSGFADNYVADGIVDRTQAIDTILSSPLAYGIGEKYAYSAEGYNLLAIIIELVSGESYETYLTKNLFKPAQLEESGFWGFENAGIDVIAAWNKPELMNNFPATIISDEKSYPNYGYKGATGIYSTVQDLWKWVGALRNKEILRAESLDMMFNPQVSARGDLAKGVFYGYGWFLEYEDGALREIRHGGAEADGIGHNGMIRFYENNSQIIVLSDAGVYKGDGRLNGVEWGIVLSFDLRTLVEANY